MLILPKRKSSKGSYGSYFKLNRSKGVKVLRGSFKSIIAAMNSRKMEAAIQERDYLNKAYNSHDPISPYCHGVTLIQSGSNIRIGIVMQHLGEMTLRNCVLNEDEKDEIIESLEHMLLERGIDHRDLHEDNVMIKDGKYYAIDFSPDYITLEDIEDAA